MSELHLPLHHDGSIFLLTRLFLIFQISAQESRRKKKEYMDQLERKVEILVNENSDYKKRVKNLEDSNASLLSQLHKLQALVNKHNLKKS